MENESASSSYAASTNTNVNGTSAPALSEHSSRSLYVRIEKAIADLHDSDKRGSALKELCIIYRTNKSPQLPLILLQAASVLLILIYEITSTATRLHINVNAPTNYKRTADCITLIKCLLEHTEGRDCLLAANILYYLCLFLQASASQISDLELIQLSVYDIFLTLIKIDSQSFMKNVDEQEIIPSTLRIMERGEEKCILVAAHFLLTLMSCDEFINKITVKRERLEHFLLVMRKASQHALDKRKIVLHKIILKTLLCLTKKKSSLRLMREHLLPYVERADLWAFSEENESTSKWHRTLLVVMRPENTDLMSSNPSIATATSTSVPSSTLTLSGIAQISETGCNDAPPFAQSSTDVDSQGANGMSQMPLVSSASSTLFPSVFHASDVLDSNQLITQLCVSDSNNEVENTTINPLDEGDKDISKLG